MLLKVDYDTVFLGLGAGLAAFLKMREGGTPEPWVYSKSVVGQAPVLYDALVEQGLNPKPLKRYCLGHTETVEVWRAVGLKALLGDGVYIIKPHSYKKYNKKHRGMHTLVTGGHGARLFSVLRNGRRVNCHSEYVTGKICSIPRGNLFNVYMFGICTMIGPYPGCIPRIEWES